VFTGATLAALAVAAVGYRWMSDDGFIVLRVVRQVQDGHGPVFNAGERVEAVTSPLWLWVLVAADALTPVRLEFLAVALGIAGTLAGLAAAAAAAARLTAAGPDGRGRVLVPAGLLVLAGLPPFWKFASGGLENGLVTVWIGISVLGLAGWAVRDGHLRWPWLVWLGLGPLVRPELALASAVFVGTVAFDRARRAGLRAALGAVAIALALPVAYQVFRMGYYGSLVPNPAFAKEAGRSWWSQGRRYLRETVEPYRLWIPALLVALGAYAPVLAGQIRAGRHRAAAVTLGSAAAGLATGTYVVRVGGDFMQARLLLPALVLLAAPVAVVPLRAATLPAAGVAVWAVVSAAAWRAPGGLDAPTTFGPAERGKVTLEAFGWGPGGRHRAFFDGRGIYFLDRKLPVAPRPGGPDPAVVQYGVGIPAYALGTGTYVLDALGLADPFTAHLELGPARGIVAHEKPLLPPWIVARLAAGAGGLGPDDFPQPRFFTGIDRNPYGEPFERRVAQARRALRCPRVRELLAASRAPLGPGRFVTNLRAAWRDWSFRIPREPRDAVAALCPARSR
jgi:arabinofuranosyltransferase